MSQLLFADDTAPAAESEKFGCSVVCGVGGFQVRGIRETAKGEID